MKNIKSLLVAGTVATSLSVSAFLLPVSVSGIAINTGNIATYDDGGGNYTLTAAEYELESDLDLGTGMITIDGAVVLNFGGHKITATNLIVPETASLTLSGEGGVIGSVTSNGTLTINGGVYDASAGWGGALNVNAGTTTVNGGEFKAGGGSAAYIAGDSTVIISGGSFTSTGDNGIEANGGVNMTISGGVFSGRASGINLSNASIMTLSGGTFSYSGTGEDGHGAIAIFGGEESAFSGFLASGYKYDDATVNTKTWYGLQIARLAGTIVNVVPISTPAGETVDPAGNTNPTGGGYGDSCYSYYAV